MAIEERVMVCAWSLLVVIKNWEKAKIEESRGRRRGSASSREGSGD